MNSDCYEVIEVTVDGGNTYGPAAVSYENYIDFFIDILPRMMLGVFVPSFIP
jgi:hypothetical protein